MNSSLFTASCMRGGVTKINSITQEFCFLVEGETKAALIDTGTGFGNIRQFVESLTSKPIMVLATHGHRDHAGGAFWFDEVYMNPADYALFQKGSTLEKRKEFVDNTLKSMGIPYVTNSEDYVAQRNISLLPLREGDTFPLGGRVLEAVEIPGHTKGSVVLIDRENKILFAGDAANDSTFLFRKEESTTVKEYLESLKKLKLYCQNIDHYYICHMKSPLSTSLVDDLLEICQEILDGKLPGEPLDFALTVAADQVRIAKAVDSLRHRLDKKIGNLLFNPDHIF